MDLLRGTTEHLREREGLGEVPRAGRLKIAGNRDIGIVTAGAPNFGDSIGEH
jgi:hypothetical protein